jgi:tetratricopeptide (TPR) repeat protein
MNSPASTKAILDKALALQRTGNPADAIRLLQDLVRRDPNNAEALNQLAGVCLQTGQFDAVLRLTERVLMVSQKKPDRAKALARQSAALEGLQQPRRALEVARQAWEADKGEVMALAAYATALEKNQRPAEALPILKDGLKRNPGENGLLIKLARCELAAGSPDNALAQLSRTRVDTMTPIWRREYAFLRAQALDRKGDYPRAWQAFEEANGLAALAVGNKTGSTPPFLGLVEKMVQVLRTRGAGRHRFESFLPADDTAPAFLLGFPRTGSTLVDQLLGGCAEVSALEEKPLLNPVLRLFAPQELDRFPADVFTLDTARRGTMRQAWLDEAARLNGAPLRARIADKQPLNTIYIPLLLSMFPHGRVVFLMRDPLDVVLSCFLQDFAPSPALICFQRMDTTVRLFDAVMQLWLLYREQVDFTPLDLRYEQVVDDLPGSTRTLYDFLGLPFSEEVLDFTRTAREREVSTASYNQVTQGLYRRSLARWRHYEAQLAPWQDVLAPWRKQFGYAD